MMACVNYVKQQIGRARFLQCGPEAGHQVVRQFSDEADSVGDPGPLPLTQIHFSGQRIEGGEQAVFHHDFVLAREPSQDARLAGVGVADQRDTQHGIAPRPEVLPVFLDTLELGFESLNLAADDPAVGFQLGFAGSAQPDATADAGQVGPHPGKSGQEVLQLRQLDLQFGLVTSSAGAEDVENDFGPVHDPDLELPLQVGSLYRRELFIEDDQ